MSENDPAVKYAVDIVFCIDTTYSMTPYLDSVKSTALKFQTQLESTMAKLDKAVDQLRVSIVDFRDLDHDGPESIQQSPFYVLPDQAQAYDDKVSGLAARDKPGPIPESALEALAVAIRSPWERSRDKRRHIIVMCTDAPAYPLGEIDPPADFGQIVSWPSSLDDLLSMWGDSVDDGEMEYSAKRLIIFGPNDYPWNEMMDAFENCIWMESAAGDGMREIEMQDILSLIAGSV